MKKMIALTATSLLVLAGCATDSEETEVPTTTTSTATSSTTAPTTSEAPEPSPEPANGSAPAPEVAPVVPVAPVAVPTFVRCYLADGTALMSDGSHVYVDRCHESASHPSFDSGAARAWSECVIANGQDYCARQFAPAPAPSPDPLPDGFTRDPSGALIRPPEVEAEKQAGQAWWAECMASNTADYCRANDPWQN